MLRPSWSGIYLAISLCGDEVDLLVLRSNVICVLEQEAVASSILHNTRDLLLRFIHESAPFLKQLMGASSHKKATRTTAMRSRATAMPRTHTVALPPSSTNSGNGALIVTILSAHDLPFHDETPLAVSMQIAGAQVRTGPPISHQQSTNSFKFQQKVSVNSPLATLYKSKAVLTVEYPSHSFTTILECKQVCIHETTSLTLKLKQNVPPEVTRSSITTSISQDSAVDSPTLKLQVCLEGPLRREVTALVHVIQGLVSSSGYSRGCNRTSCTFGKICVTPTLASVFPSLLECWLYRRYSLAFPFSFFQSSCHS